MVYHVTVQKHNTNDENTINNFLIQTTLNMESGWWSRVTMGTTHVLKPLPQVDCLGFIFLDEGMFQ